MLKLGNLWIELWELSDITLWVFAAGLISSLLFGVIFCTRNMLEQSLTKGQINKILKLLIVYTLVVMPLFTMIILYKRTFHHVGFYPGDDGIDTIWIIGDDSISFSTAHGNHWIFMALLGVWLTGFLIRGLSFVIRNRRLMRRLQAVSHPCQNREILEMKEKLIEELGIQKSVSLWENELMLSPFVTGEFRPKIFLPRTGYMQKGLRWILLHELIHCRERDALYRRLLFWLSALYWFNPLFSVWTDYYIEINEMACDEQVLRERSKLERQLYAHVLVDMERENGFWEHAVSLTGYAKSLLERRLENMLHMRRGISKRTMGALTLALALICPMTTLAASVGVSEAQDAAVQLLIEEQEEFGIATTPGDEEVDHLGNRAMERSGVQVQPRGATYVDVEVNGKTSMSLGKVTVLANGKINVWLEGDSENDSFRAGYIDSSGKRTSISSSDGAIVHAFSIRQVGTYELFVEGLKTGTMHITGSITVK